MHEISLNIYKCGFMHVEEIKASNIKLYARSFFQSENWCPEIHKRVFILKFIIYGFTRVCLSTGGSTWAGTPPGTRYTPPTRHTPRDQVHNPRDGYCCGWYASYWNAFLLQHCFMIFCLFLFARKADILGNF